MDVKGIVIVHLAPLELSYCYVFDVLVRRDLVNDFKWLKEIFYEVKCPIVEKVLKYLNNYEYIGSEDTCHGIFGYNGYIMGLVNELVEKHGFIELIFEEEPHNVTIEDVEKALKEKNLI